MMSTSTQSLLTASRERMSKYEDIRSNVRSNYPRIPFWDIVVITARDESQKEIFEHQISVKKKRQEIPLFVRYIVISDPPGAKIGSGGSTLHSLEYLHSSISSDVLNTCKVMLIHAGGHSQRLPNQSILGKAFLTLPCSRFPLQMLDALLMMYVDIPEKMNPGVFVAASDVLFLYNGEGIWDFRNPGFTAIAHPASIGVAENHGVFILEDMSTLWKSYKIDPSRPSVMTTAKCFVHKQRAAVLQQMKAIIPETDCVYVDLAYYFDIPTMHKLIKFYADTKPLTCEMDAYGDFLQALGPGATVNTSSADEKPELREQIFSTLNEIPLKVVIFHEAQFNHVGTVSEFLYHMCDNVLLRNAYQFHIQDLKVEEKEKHSRGRGDLLSSSDGYVVMHSILHDKTEDNFSVESGSVIEYCIVEKAVSIGQKCLLSNLHIPEYSVVPAYTFMYTMMIKMNKEIFFATCVLGVYDDLKYTQPRTHALDLKFLHVPLSSVTDCMSVDILWPQNVQCSLWTARLFPICGDRRESCKTAIQILKGVKDKCLINILEKHSQLVSMEEVLQRKASISMLDYQTELYS